MNSSYPQQNVSVVLPPISLDTANHQEPNLKTLALNSLYKKYPCGMYRLFSTSSLEDNNTKLDDLSYAEANTDEILRFDPEED